MSTLVVYDSVFGNTEKVARAAGAVLSARVVKVTEIQPADLQGVTMLLVGSPTRAFSPLPSISGWLKSLPAGSLNGVRAAAFDTRYTDVSAAQQPGILKWLAGIFGYAAEKLTKTLASKGAQLAGQPGQFSIDDSEGPLSVNELDRAAAWARTLLG